MLADDTTLILKDIKSVQIAFKIYENFRLCSGLNLNLDKKLIPIGTNQNNIVIKLNLLGKLKVKSGPFKTLGIWFSDKTKDMVDLYFKEKIENKLLFIWTSRNLSLKGKNNDNKIFDIATSIFFSYTYICPKVYS